MVKRVKKICKEGKKGWGWGISFAPAYPYEKDMVKRVKRVW